MPSRAAVNSCVSRGGLAAPGRSDRRGARGVHHALHPRPQALLHHELRAAHVHLEQPLLVRRAHGGHACAVEHALDALQRPPDRAPVAHVELQALAVEVRDRRVGGAVLHAQPNLVAALDQQPCHVGPDEAGRSGDEGLGQLRPEACAACGSPSKRRWSSRQRTASGTTFSRSGGIGWWQLHADAVDPPGERPPRLGDPALLLVEEDVGGLVELLLVGRPCRCRPGGCPRERARSRACRRFRGALPGACASAPRAARRDELRCAASLLQGTRVYGVGHDSSR